MLSYLEFRIFKAFSKFPNYFLIPSDRFEGIDEERFTNRKFEVFKKTKIAMFHIDTTIDKLIELKYMVRSSDITPLGYSELGLFWKSWFKKGIDSLCKIYLPLIISIAALIISIFF